MIIKSQSPCRISLFGGGTDVEPYLSKKGSVIISLAITLRQYMTIYTKDNVYEQLRDTFPPNADTKFIYDIFDKFHFSGGNTFKIKSTSDAILQSGLGSSAAAALCVLACVNKVKDLNMDLNHMAEEARYAEISQGWTTGIQDQISSVYGGLNVIETGGQLGSQIQVVPFRREIGDLLLRHMALFYIGKRQIAKPQEGLGIVVEGKDKILDSIRDSAFGVLDYLEKGDIKSLGKLLDISWKLKKQSNPYVTSERIDHIYEQAKKAGAYGGKIMGAGSGGYMFFLIDKNQKKEFIKTIEQLDCQHVDFDIDWQGTTVRVIENE